VTRREGVHGGTREHAAARRSCQQRNLFCRAATRSPLERREKRSFATRDKSYSAARGPTGRCARGRMLLAACGGNVAANAAPTDGGNDALAMSDATRDATPFDSTTIDGATSVPEATLSSDGATRDAAIQDVIAADTSDEVGSDDGGRYDDGSPYLGDAEASAPATRTQAATSSPPVGVSSRTPQPRSRARQDLPRHPRRTSLDTPSRPPRAPAADAH
jgi:hypothetical protein